MAEADERQAQWLRGVLDLAVLATLQRQGPTYGYLLIQELAATGIDNLKGGTVYPLLSRLEQDGLVTSRWRVGASGPARKYFDLTDKGTAALRSGSDGWRTFVDRMDVLLAPAPAPTTTGGPR